jgi:hypothetical protein
MAPARPRHAQYRRIRIDIDTAAPKCIAAQLYRRSPRQRRRASCGYNKCCGE